MGAHVDRRPALVASAALHAAVLLGGLIAWPWLNKPMHLGSVVPVTLVTSQDASNMRPAIQAPTPAPAAAEQPEPKPAPLPPAPEAAPVPAPPPTVRTPPQPKAVPHPQAEARPQPKPSPTPKPIVQAKPTPPKPTPPKAAAQPSFDPDAILASLDKASKAAGSRHASGQRGPTRPETAVRASLSPGVGSTVSASALSDLGSELQRLWNPNCQVEGAADVVIKVSFQLGPAGRLIGDPQASGGDSSNPVVRAASDRARRAIYQGAPFDSLPQALYGQRITVNFNAKQFCANR
ncbi:MAG: energy transducer TonB [Caulobacteraceae bacterium]|nr:energy transducer TonB [Caulobacteraceae bacterium]